MKYIINVLLKGDSVMENNGNNRKLPCPNCHSSVSPNNGIYICKKCGTKIHFFPAKKPDEDGITETKCYCKEMLNLSTYALMLRLVLKKQSHEDNCYHYRPCVRYRNSKCKCGNKNNRITFYHHNR